MIRLFNLLALVAVIASATWAYSVKYETILVAEKLRKREAELQRERDVTAILQAEWHLLNRPSRMQALKKPEAGLQNISAKQIVRPADIPERPPEAPDALDGLLTGSISLATPDPQRKAARADATPPATPRQSASRIATQGAMGVRSKATVTTVPVAKAATRPVAQAAPVRLVPPARVGPTPAAREVPAAPSTPPAEGGLTGFLKRLVP
jgi:hypothetical protein